MKQVRVISDLTECEEIWKRVVPAEQLSDLWEVRACFHRQYLHRPHFIVCENGRGVSGFLPLCYNGETRNYVYFPGETWSGKTWLEQNRLIARSNTAVRQMLSLVSGPYYLRYLQPTGWMLRSHPVVDEIGYHFLPPKYDFSMDSYFAEFSGKSRKRITREIDTFQSRGVEFVYDDDAAFETMVSMNLGRYAESSYFFDPRFLRSFRSLTNLLRARGWLRFTSVLVGGQVAAVDMGCVFNGTYTLLAGGTQPDFPGIAKLINLHHMRWACEQKLDRVDFLCGDFNWKTQFHLTPSPLYALTGDGSAISRPETMVKAIWPAQDYTITARSASRA